MAKDKQKKQRATTEEKQRQSCRWMYTLYDLNVTPQDEFPEDIVKFHVYQLEVCPKTEREHVQGYIVFKSNQRFNHLKETYHKGIHWESCIGNHQQCYDYCTKEDTRAEPHIAYELGDYEPGKRTDLQKIQHDLDQGRDMRTVATENFSTWVKYNKAFDKYVALTRAPRSNPVEVHVYWGEPGTGKTRKAFEENPTAYWKPADKWWDSYDGQTTIIMDDYRNWLSESELLRVCDRYPLMVECKGSHHNFIGNKIIITSNHHPKDWGLNWTTTPFKRRITKCHEFTLREGMRPHSLE